LLGKQELKHAYFLLQAGQLVKKLYAGKFLKLPFAHIGETGEKLKCAWQTEEKQGKIEDAWLERNSREVCTREFGNADRLTQKRIDSQGKIREEGKPLAGSREKVKKLGFFHLRTKEGRDAQSSPFRSSRGRSAVAPRRGRTPPAQQLARDEADEMPYQSGDELEAKRREVTQGRGGG
jgi:hypothetical protein